MQLWWQQPQVFGDSSWRAGCENVGFAAHRGAVIVALKLHISMWLERRLKQTLLQCFNGKGYVQRKMSLRACVTFTSRERKYPRKVLVMGKFQNLMERVTTKTWLKLLKGILCQGIRAFTGMRIFSIEVVLPAWKRGGIILLLSL